MQKQIYAIYGLKSESDEQMLLEELAPAFPDYKFAVSFLCATLTVTAEQVLLENEEQQIAAICEARGFSLQMPATIQPVSDKEKNARRSPKEGGGIPPAIFIAALCAVLVFSVLFTYTFAASSFNAKLRDFYLNHGSTIISGTVEDSTNEELDLLRSIFDLYSVHELDDEALKIAVLKAYVNATDDDYAVFYTGEELEALYTDDSGEMVGIGVSVVNTDVPINGVEYRLLTVISCYKGGSAYEAGIMPGDIIYSLLDENGDVVYVDAVGQTQAINMIRGIEGSEVTITILRPVDAESYEPITLTLPRRTVITHSVEGRVCYADPTIGIIKISEFDMTTPPQFKETMNELIKSGCNQFIFDLRYNGGGDLQSIEAVLSTMLQVGDPMIYTVDKDGNEEVDVVRVVEHTGRYEGCTVTPKDIGIYRGYDMVVLTNQYTASAAELFTANLRDYDIATQVGVKTFGKGCMQKILDLSYFGIDGGLRLTTAWYLPPCKESYHDIGIIPDEENLVEMDETLFETYHNVYLIPDEEDNQLTAAIQVLQSR